MTTNLFIGGEIYIPGRALSLKQMTAIQLSIQLGNDTYSGAAQGTLEAQAYAQYLAQGGQQFIANAIATGALATVSSGDIVGNANKAREDNANATRPIVATEVLTPDKRIVPEGSGSGTNANPTPTTETNGDTGTDATVRTISQTQAINNTSNLNTGGLASIGVDVRVGLYGPGGAAPRADINGPGGAAPGDDQRGSGGGPTGTNALRTRLDQLYAGPTNAIIAQDNILDQYPSYTYSLSWYLMDPDNYNETKTKVVKNLNGYYLLAQSGGANIGTGIYNPGETGPLAGTAGRNPYFNLDYYIDNLVIETVSGVDSGGPIAFKSLHFTITEPNGITLQRNLYAAMNELYKSKGFIPADAEANYTSGIFCMAIRFYGYDENGQLVQPIARTTGATDNRAAVEKFIFFAMTDLKFSVSSKLVEYQISGAVPEDTTALSSNRGSIPADYQFSGATVRDILVGQIQEQTASQAAGDETRGKNPIKPTPPVKFSDLSRQQQAAIAAGTDPNTVNDQGMAFGGGGL